MSKSIPACCTKTETDSLIFNCSNSGEFLAFMLGAAASETNPSCFTAFKIPNSRSEKTSTMPGATVPQKCLSASSASSALRSSHWWTPNNPENLLTMTSACLSPVWPTRSDAIKSTPILTRCCSGSSLSLASLRASLWFSGRLRPIYEEIHTISLANAHRKSD